MKSSVGLPKTDLNFATRVHPFPAAARGDLSMRHGRLEFDPVEFARAVREVSAAAGALRRRRGRIATLLAKWRPRLVIWLSIGLLWGAIGLALASLLPLYVALSQ